MHTSNKGLWSKAEAYFALNFHMRIHTLTSYTAGRNNEGVNRAGWNLAHSIGFLGKARHWEWGGRILQLSITSWVNSCLLFQLLFLSWELYTLPMTPISQETNLRWSGLEDHKLCDEVRDSHSDQGAVYDEHRPGQLSSPLQGHHVHDARQSKDVRQSTQSSRKPWWRKAEGFFGNVAKSTFSLRFWPWLQCPCEWQQELISDHCRAVCGAFSKVRTTAPTKTRLYEKKGTKDNKGKHSLVPNWIYCVYFLNLFSLHTRCVFTANKLSSKQ